MNTQSGNSLHRMALFASIAVLLYCLLSVAAIVGWNPALINGVNEHDELLPHVSTCLVCDARQPGR